MAELCETWKSPKCDVDEVFNRAIARNPKIPATFVIIGIHQERTKASSAAIESFKRALAIDPNSVNANYNIALAYLDSGQYELANEHAQKAYALGCAAPRTSRSPEERRPLAGACAGACAAAAGQVDRQSTTAAVVHRVRFRKELAEVSRRNGPRDLPRSQH